MPHYKDGTEARVGDHVTGKCYNTDHVVAGTIISITPGSDSCNCQVQFTEAVRAEDRTRGLQQGPPPRMARQAYHHSTGIAPGFIERVVRGEQHGTAGDEFVLFECVDYCAISDLTKVG